MQIKFNFNNFIFYNVCLSQLGRVPAAYDVVAGGCDWPILCVALDGNRDVWLCGRYNQRCSRGNDRRRRQPRWDPRVRQTVQDTTIVAGSNTDSGRTGAQCYWRTFVQPVCHLPVCAPTVFTPSVCGRPNSLACLSVCPIQAPNSKKGVQKSKDCRERFTWAGVTGMPIFSLKDQRLLLELELRSRRRTAAQYVDTGPTDF